MNEDLAQLQPYPFQRLAALFAQIHPNADYSPVKLSIGEPKHAAPELVREAMLQHLDGLSSYPLTIGSEVLRQTLADWLQQRYQLPPLDAASQVLPVNGSREALFAFAQTVIDRGQSQPLVLCPNPFYQIYEGAALLAGAQPLFLNTLAENQFALDFSQISAAQWRHVQLVYVCSPGNPTGQVMTLAQWQQLFELSDQYGFVIAADECYSEIYFDQAPLGGMQAAQQLGRDDYRNLVVFSSLSKRSNVPGLRSGFVAGDANILQQFKLYRTYHGSAMSPVVQMASVAAWQDEAHVEDNRRLYRQKFDAALQQLRPVCQVNQPEAGFYLWLDVQQNFGLSDTDFAQNLYRDYNVVVLPGSFLAREAQGVNPGRNYVRMALVADVDETAAALERVVQFVR